MSPDRDTGLDFMSYRATLMPLSKLKILYQKTYPKSNQNSYSRKTARELKVIASVLGPCKAEEFGK